MWFQFVGNALICDTKHKVNEITVIQAFALEFGAAQPNLCLPIESGQTRYILN